MMSIQIAIRANANQVREFKKIEKCLKNHNKKSLIILVKFSLRIYWQWLPMQRHK